MSRPITGPITGLQDIKGKRRIKRLLVTPETLVNGLCRLNGKSLVTAHGMPDDARVVRSYIEWSKDIAIIVESDTFPEVEDDSRYIPDLYVTLTHVWRGPETA